MIFMASLLPLVHALHGQVEDHSPWSIALAGGISVPAIKVERAPFAPDLSGEPRPGPVVAISAEYELLPWLVGTLQGNYTHMAAEELTEAELFPPCIGCALGGGTSRQGYTQQQGTWAMAQALGGLGLRGSDGRFTFILHIEGGAQWTRRPAVEVESHGTIWTMGNPYYGTYTTRTVQPWAEAWTLVGGGGVDLGFALSPQVGLRLGTALRAGALGMDRYSQSTTTSQRNDGSGPQTSSYQSIPVEVQRTTATYQATLGVTYRFRSK